MHWSCWAAADCSCGSSRAALRCVCPASASCWHPRDVIDQCSFHCHTCRSDLNTVQSVDRYSSQCRSDNANCLAQITYEWSSHYRRDASGFDRRVREYMRNLPGTNPSVFSSPLWSPGHPRSRYDCDNGYQGQHLPNYSGNGHHGWFPALVFHLSWDYHWSNSGLHL